jgi:hypothetical protein
MSDDAATPDGGCQPCDLEGVEELACQAAKYQKQAEVMTQVATDLATYKTQYGEGRKTYGQAWEDTQAEIALVRAQLDEIYGLLQCRLTPGQKDCLDKAAEQVFDDIDTCTPDPGCCVGDCTFDDSVGADATVATLTQRIDDYRRLVKADTACFTSLIGEAKTITDQVAAIKTEVTALAADVTAPDNTKLPRWYARWLIASYRLDVKHLGHGFTSVSAYSDCLCTALQCIAAGWAAIAVLEGARAELACLESAKEETCKLKIEQTLEAILEAYDCCQSEQPDDNPKQQDSGQTDPGPEQPKGESAT